MESTREDGYRNSVTARYGRLPVEASCSLAHSSPKIRRVIHIGSAEKMALTPAE